MRQAILVASLLCCQPALAETVSFPAAGGVTVWGEYEAAQGATRATLVLFHMAGSNAAEYAPIAAKLNAMGFATLAIDQRSGGPAFGATNRTAEGSGGGDYAEAYADMEAALAFAEAKGGGAVGIWGSSYSAALVFPLAADHPQVDAVLAFSPAEYIRGRSIGDAAARLAVPVFVTSAANAGEVAAAAQIAGRVPGGAVQYEPQAGVHGSSTLRDDQNPRGAAANWQAVTDFLNTTFPLD